MPLSRIMRSVLALPFTVTVLVPLGIVLATQSAHPGWSWAGSAGGMVLVGAGVYLLAGTVSLFARVGRGTLAPWDPPKRLVVRGVYRHVRNPMISAVFSILLGETLFLGSLPLFYWFSGFVLGNMLYIPLIEEPGLEHRFGPAYREYMWKVPRWIPRLRPWEPPPDPTGESLGK